MAVLDGDRIVNVAEAIGAAGIALHTWVGQSCPAHATSSGKVLLAGLGVGEVRERLGARLESFTDETVTARSDLEAELDVVRQRGWASVREELEVGLNAVAAPVYDADARVVAALSVSGPSYRLGHRQTDRRRGREHQSASRLDFPHPPSRHLSHAISRCPVGDGPLGAGATVI